MSNTVAYKGNIYRFDCGEYMLGKRSVKTCVVTGGCKKCILEYLEKTIGKEWDEESNDKSIKYPEYLFGDAGSPVTIRV